LLSQGNGRFSGAFYKLDSGFNTLFNSISVKKYTGDFNGDGLTDVAGFLENKRTIPILQSRPGGGFTCVRTPLPATVAAYVTAVGTTQLLADFNGDGLTDIACLNNNSHYHSVPMLFSTGIDAEFTATLEPLPAAVKDLVNAAGAQPFAGDYNGDGLTDIAIFNKDLPVLPVIYSRGTGAFEARLRPLDPGAVKAFNNGFSQIDAGDLNGDHLTDFVAFNGSENNAAVLLSHGNGDYVFSRPPIPSRVAAWINTQGVNRFISDCNGDGLLDIAGIKNGYDSLPLLVAQHFQCENNLPDLMTGIRNGIGAITNISYQPFDAADTTLPDATLRYPNIGTSFPQFVVKSFTMANSADSATTVLTQFYEFRLPVIDQWRGFMGFRKTVVCNPQNATTVETTCRPEFPYQGIVIRKQIFDLRNTSECLGDVHYRYLSDADPAGGIYRIWNEDVLVDHYTHGHYNGTKERRFSYDGEHRLLLRIEENEDTAQRDHAVYTYFRYDTAPDASRWWVSSFPVEEKVSANPDGQTVFGNGWAPGDLSWKKTGYDPVMNITNQLNYRDSSAAGVAGKWVGESFHYDVFGNVFDRVSAPNAGADSIHNKIVFDARFHSFPIVVVSPRPLPAGSDTVPLEMEYQYDPRFGILIDGRDANGNTQMHIPDEGIDGFGRILVTETTKPYTHDLVTSSLTTYLPTPGNGYGILSRSPVDWSRSQVPDSSWLWETSWFDGLDREVRGEASGYDGSTRLVSFRQYDRMGRLSREYLPFFDNSSRGMHYGQQAGGTPADSLFIRQVYDAHGLLSQVWSPPAGDKDSAFLQKEEEYDSLDNRIVYTKSPSPSGDGQYFLWKKEFGFSGKIKRQSGPYHPDHSKAANYGEASWHYDLAGRLDRITDPLGEHIVFRWNSLNEMIGQWRPETDTVRITYNDNGWVIRQQDAKGEQQMRYDDLGRMVENRVMAPNGRSADTTVYSYDNDSLSINGKGQLSRISNRNYEYRYDYDNTGMLHQSSSWSAGLRQSAVQRFTYDATGRPASILYPDSSLVSYRYAYSYLSGIFLKGDTLAVYEDYTSLGDYRRARYGNGVNNRLAYDNLGRLTRSETWKAAFQMQQDEYAWNRANKLVGIRDGKKSKTIDLSQQFRYFPTGRLDTATGPYGNLTYTYDAAGNRLSASPDVYQYDPVKKHQLRSISRGGAVTSRFDYDPAGNLWQRRVGSAKASPGGFNYSFDEDGNLDSVSTLAGGSGSRLVNSFVYNAEGTRISKKDTNNTETYIFSPMFEAVKLPGGGLVYTKYIADGDRIVYSESTAGQAVRLVSRRPELAGEDKGRFAAVTGWIDRNLRPGGLGLLILWLVLFVALFRGGWASVRWLGNRRRKNRKRLYVPLFVVWRNALMLFMAFLLPAEPIYADTPPGPNGPGVPVAGEKRFFHQNQVESTVLITDENGGLTNRIVYLPFGSVDAANSTGINDFRPKFTGKELDSHTGLNYFGSRYYDSDLGRFISPDAMDQYFSPYSYGDGDPLSGLDPDGNEFVFVIALVVAAVVGAYLSASLLNGDLNPVNWEWGSAKTWVGLISGAAAGVAAVASGGAALARYGVVAAESVAVGSASASSIAFAMDVVIAATDAFTFVGQPDLEGGVYLALDLIPFGGALLGRSAKAGKQGGRAASAGAGAAEAGEEMAGLGEDAGDLLAGGEVCALSFGGNTPVLTPAGYKRIDSIRVGDLVTAYDETTQKNATHAVTRIFTREADQLLVVELPGDSLVITPLHPVYLLHRGWVDAAALKPGDSLLTNSGAPVRIRSIHHVFQESRVYNFEVEETHDYYVTRDGVLAHNPKCSKRLERMGATPSKNSKTGKEVFERWLNKANPKAKVVGGVKYVNVRTTNNGARVWMLLDAKIHMGHKVSAAEAWTYGVDHFIKGTLAGKIAKAKKYRLRFKSIPLSKLSKTGFKSTEVRVFMRMSQNYRFEYGPLNSANGSGGIPFKEN